MQIKDKENVGSLVMKRRLAESLSITDLAGKLGIDRAVLSKLEHGKANPTLSTLIKVADGLGKKLYIDIK